MKKLLRTACNSALLGVVCLNLYFLLALYVGHNGHVLQDASIQMVMRAALVGAPIGIVVGFTYKSLRWVYSA